MEDIVCSVIVASRNEGKYMERCLKTLENQSFDRSGYEIIVVDGISEDNTVKIIKEFAVQYKNIRLLNNPDKIAPCAFNTGIAHARGRYIFIVGAHAEYPPDFIGKSLDSIRANGVDCVGRREVAIGESKLGKAFAVVRNTAFGGGLSPYRYSDRKQLVKTAAFACYTREILFRAGGFHEKLVKNHDNELNQRIIQAGGKILFDPAIRFYYYTRNSLKGIFNQLFGYGFWEAKLVKKQKERLSLMTLVPMLFVLYTAAAAAVLLLKKTAVPLLLEWVPYLSIYAYFAVRAVIPKKQNVFLALFLYLLIHFSIGLGFIAGLADFKERRTL